MEDQGNGGFLAEYKAKFERLHTLNERYDQLESQQTELEQEINTLTEELVTVMDDEGVPRITIGNTTFYRKNDKYPRVKDPDAMFRWLNDIGRGDMIKPTVNQQSLRSLCNERDRENQEVPDCIELFVKKRVGTRS